jgi:PHD/YefM family antitoxin component YafN of YafNO toxin-antitoxin module
MKLIEVSQANRPLSDYAHDMAEPLVLTENGVPFAALMSIDPDDVESMQLASDPAFMEKIERAREEIRQGKSVSLEELRAELDPQ